MSTEHQAGALSFIPVKHNPNGLPSNFDDPPTLVSETTGITIAMFVITSYFVSMRVGAKVYSATRPGIDDYLCIVALLLAVAYAAIVMTMGETARHSWDVPMSYMDETWSKKVATLGLIYGPGIWFAKAAILTLYLRLFGPIKWLRVCVYSAMGVLFLVYWASVPVFTAYCFPHTGGDWDLAVVSKCRDTNTLLLFQGVFGVASDLYLLILPLPVINSLNLSLAKKLAVTFVFLHGIFAVISSCLALYYRLLQWEGDDPTWNCQNTSICLIVEMFMTIIVSSMPATSSFWNTLWNDSLARSRLVTGVRSLLYSSARNTSKGSSGASPHGQPELVGSAGRWKVGESFMEKDASHHFKSYAEVYLSPRGSSPGSVDVEINRV